MRTYSATVTRVQSDEEPVDAKLRHSAEEFGIVLMAKPVDLLFEGVH